MGLYHFVKGFSLPPAILCAALFIGLLMLRRWRHTGLTILWGTAIVFYLLAAPITANRLAWHVSRVPPLSDTTDISKAQAIVVLSAGAFIGGPEFGEAHRIITIDRTTLERVRYAAHLYHNRAQLPVLVTGGKIFGLPLPLGTAMKQVLEHDFKVPVTWAENESRDTIENAAFSAKILREAGVTSIILVTHASHMPRALKLFAAQGLDVIPAPTGFPPTVRFLPADLIPRMSAFDQSEASVYELLAYVWHDVL